MATDTINGAVNPPRWKPGTDYPELFAALAHPFTNEEVKTRNYAGRDMAYITARTVMNRLDAVLGPENWWDEYSVNDGSVVCTLSIQMPTGAVLSKTDAGGRAGMQDSNDDDKSGFSDAFKRAAVKFGVARYLYRDGYIPFTDPEDTAKLMVYMTPTGLEPRHGDQRPQGQRQPAQDRPQRDDRGREDTRGHGGGNAPQGRPGGQGERGVPRHGKALFAWTKQKEEEHNVGLLQYINKWAKLQDFPGRMVDWDETQVKLAHDEMVKKLDDHTPRDEDYPDTTAY